MAFNFSAGLSLMGDSIAKTAGVLSIESQKQAAQKEMLELADQMANVRDDKQRTFQSSERVESQAWQGDQKSQDRSHAEKLANLQAETAIKTAGIGAGATMAAARMRSDDARLDRADAKEKFDKQFDANKPLLSAEILAKEIKTNSEKLVLEARTELQKARESNDPAKIKAAQQKEFDATYSSQAHVQQVSVYQAQAKQLGDALQAAQTRLVALQNSAMASAPENRAAIAQLETQAKSLYGQYMAAVRQADDAIKNLPAASQPGAAAATGGPDLSKYMATPPTSQITGAPKKPPSLMNDRSGGPATLDD